MRAVIPVSIPQSPRLSHNKRHFYSFHSGSPETFPQGGKPKTKLEGKSVKSEDNLPRRKKGVAIKCWETSKDFRIPHWLWNQKITRWKKRAQQTSGQRRSLSAKYWKTRDYPAIVHHRANGSGLLELWLKLSIKFQTHRKMSIIWWQVGFMDNGRIKALDIECFINGGCTLDDSELVRISETSAILVCE